MRQQITVAEKRGKPGSKPEFDYLVTPDAPIESHRQKYKELKRAGSVSKEYKTLAIYERVKVIQLRTPKEAKENPTATDPAPPESPDKEESTHRKPVHHHKETSRHHEKHR